MRTGAQCVIDALQKAGVTTVFGLPGGAVLDIFSAAYHASFNFILARHEQGAAHMADGYARATGKVGVCIVTSGPGATNAVTGLATANMDGIPVVCISGQVPSSLIGNDAFQEADTTGITRPVTKHNFLVKHVDELPRTIAEAFYLASTGKPGPVLVDIPKDIQQQKTDAEWPGEVKMRGYVPVSDPDPAEVAALADAINASKKPLLYVGGGVISGSASAELAALAHRMSAPVTTTLMGLGSFPETDPLALRMLGMHGSVAANRAVTECDLLVAVGSRFDDRVTGRVSEFAPNATIAHIDIDPSVMSRSVQADLVVVGQVKPVLASLLRQVEEKDRSEWVGQTAQWREAHPFDYDRDNPRVLPQYVIEQVYELTKGDAVIVTEVGQHQMWSTHFYKYTRPRTFISSGGLGTMGFGMPAAIGAQLGCPAAIVVDIAGDGSIQMNFQELVVAVEHKLPINVVILNNGYLGMVRQWQEMFYRKEYSATRLGQTGRSSIERINEPVEDVYLPDFVKLAEAHGALGLRATTKEEVTSSLAKAFGSDRPAVVECVVESSENVFPMVPPGASLQEMVLV